MFSEEGREFFLKSTVYGVPSKCLSQEILCLSLGGFFVGLLDRRWSSIPLRGKNMKKCKCRDFNTSPLPNIHIIAVKPH